MTRTLLGTKGITTRSILATRNKKLPATETTLGPMSYGLAGRLFGSPAPEEVVGGALQRRSEQRRFRTDVGEQRYTRILAMSFNHVHSTAMKRGKFSCAKAAQVLFWLHRA